MKRETQNSAAGRNVALGSEFRIWCSKCAVRPLLLGGCGFRGGIGVLLGEAFDAAGGVNKFLLAGEKRMAVRADFDVQPVTLDRGAGLEIVPAGAMHGYGMIIGVNTGFHVSPVCRVRSARLACGSRPTAASLGLEELLIIA